MSPAKSQSKGKAVLISTYCSTTSTVLTFKPFKGEAITRAKLHSMEGGMDLTIVQVLIRTLSSSLSAPSRPSPSLYPCLMSHGTYKAISGMLEQKKLYW